MAPIRAICTVLAVLALAACGSDGMEGAEETTTDGVAGVQTETGAEPTVIEIVETSFDLSSPRVENEGERLELTLEQPGAYTFRAVNRASTAHALAIRGHGLDVETESIPPGESAELNVTFDETGEYDVWCPIANHRELGMEGTIVVGEGAGTRTGTGMQTQTETDVETETDESGGGLYGGG